MYGIKHQVIGLLINNLILFAHIFCLNLANMSKMLDHMVYYRLVRLFNVHKLLYSDICCCYYPQQPWRQIGSLSQL
uniref:Secreted protein n=1 Tax=Schistosoma mansoni TaxID=6183 RepID=A0A5K4F7A1_SCHMA